MLTVVLGNSYKYPMHHSQRVTKVLLEINREYPQPVNDLYILSFFCQRAPFKLSGLPNLIEGLIPLNIRFSCDDFQMKVINRS